MLFDHDLSDLLQSSLSSMFVSRFCGIRHDLESPSYSFLLSKSLHAYVGIFFSSPTLSICHSFFIVCDDPWVFVGWDETFIGQLNAPSPTCIFIYLYLEENLEDRYPELYTRGFVLLFYGVLPAVIGRCDWSEMI